MKKQRCSDWGAGGRLFPAVEFKDDEREMQENVKQIVHWRVENRDLKVKCLERERYESLEFTSYYRKQIKRSWKGQPRLEQDGILVTTKLHGGRNRSSAQERGSNYGRQRQIITFTQGPTGTKLGVWQLCQMVAQIFLPIQHGKSQKIRVLHSQ